MVDYNPILSVMIPTRGRFNHLIRVIDSYIDNADDKNSVEFIIKFDNDDVETYQRIPSIRKDARIKYIISDRENGYLSMHIFANYMYKLCDGYWIIFGTDDGLMVTKGWDKYLKKIKGYSLINPSDDLSDRSEIFPIVNAEVPKDLGFYCMNHAQDRWLQHVHNKSNTILWTGKDLNFRHTTIDDQNNIDRRNAEFIDDWDETKDLRDYSVGRILNMYEAGRL